MTEMIEDKTMVERIAEAIWAEQKPDGVPGYWDLDFLDQGKIKMIARACIKVMREPTDEMVAAIATDDDVAPIWRLMIDAALVED